MKTFIIAEAGVNHNGSVVFAKKLIDRAIDAKCDAVKFQTFITELSISKTAKKAAYQINNTKNESESQYEMVKSLELSFEHFEELKEYCGDKIKFLSTPFDLPSIEFLVRIGIDIFKIPSGEMSRSEKSFPYGNV